MYVVNNRTSHLGDTKIQTWVVFQQYGNRNWKIAEYRDPKVAEHVAAFLTQYETEEV